MVVEPKPFSTDSHCFRFLSILTPSLVLFVSNTPDKIRRTGNICHKLRNIGPSSTKFDIEIAEISYFDIVEQQRGIIHR